MNIELKILFVRLTQDPDQEKTDSPCFNCTREQR